MSTAVLSFQDPMAVLFPSAPWGWKMPRPPQPHGAFLDDDTRDIWASDRAYRAVIGPGAHLLVDFGGKSDGASIPKILQTCFTPKFERATFAQAWVHDHLYGARLVRRELADWIFYKQLLAGNVHPAKALSYYLAVSVGGVAAWALHTPDSVREARQLATLQIMEAAA